MALDGMDNKVKNLKAMIAKKKAMKGLPADSIENETRKPNPFIPTNPKDAQKMFGRDLPLRKGSKR